MIFDIPTHPYWTSRSITLAVLGTAIMSANLAGCIALPMAVGASGVFAGQSQPPANYASAAPVPVIQPVVEPTDAQMNCAQLIAASSSMDQTIASESAAAHPAPSSGFTNAVMHTAASMAIGALSGFAPGATYLTPAANGLQQQQITQEQFQAQSQAQAESQGEMAINNAEQRKMYLATLTQQKNCPQSSMP
jgi:hypothetical protein